MATLVKRQGRHYLCGMLRGLLNSGLPVLLRSWVVIVALAFGMTTAFSAERPFEVRTVTYTPPESQPLTRYLVILETNQMAFLPPAQWRVQARAQDSKVIISPLDGSAQMGFALCPEFDGKTNELTKVEAAALLTKRFPGATVKEENPFHCGSGSGFGYEINLAAVAKGDKLDVTVGYVQLPVGVVEFQRLCPVNQKEALRIPFMHFLTSFTVEPKVEPATQPAEKK
jgi:hypothetical protein